MRFNHAGLDIIKSEETFEANWYQDSKEGTWTIGYGQTFGRNASLEEARERMLGTFEYEAPITEQDAEIMMMFHITEDIEFLRQRFDRVKSMRFKPLSDNQFSALVSFVYNIGQGAFASSTMYQRLINDSYDAAADEFERWVYQNGEVRSGLIKRRQREKQLFLTPDISRPVETHNTDL